MAISSPGLGSNLDVNSIISQLMTIEQQPLALINRKEASFQAKISGLGTLKSALSTLLSSATTMASSTTQTAVEKFTSFKATVADSTIATASAGTTAATGTYTLSVSQLAQAHRLTSAGNPTVNQGTLTLEIGTYDLAAQPAPTFTRKTGTNAVSVTIDAGNATIEGVRDAINAARAGVRASVVNGVGGKQLVVESTVTGAQSAIRLTGNTGIVYDAADPGSNTLTQLTAAQNSAAKINGIDVGGQSNTITDAIEGISVTLAKGPEAPATSVSTTFTVSRDTSSLTSALNAFVKDYNEVNKSIRTLGAFNASTGEAGILNGDATLRTIQAAMRNTISTVPAGLAGDFRRLSDIGVQVQPDGSLKLDSTRLNSAAGSNFAAVATTVTAYGDAFKKALDSITASTGLLAARTDGINASIKSLDRQREALQLRLTQTETRLRRQFTALDSLVSGLNTTSTFLTQQLARLPSTA